MLPSSLLCGALWMGLALDGPEAALHARPWLAAAALLWSAMLVGSSITPLAAACGVTCGCARSWGG